MRQRSSVESDEWKAEAAAHAMMLDVVLPRLLRLANDADAEATSVLAGVQRRLAALQVRGEIRSTAMVNMALASAQRILEAAAREERGRRAAELANDGTP